MKRPSAIGYRLSAIAATLLLFWLLSGWLLLHPPAFQLDVGAPGDGYTVVNFFGGELSAGGEDFRWSGRAARLLFHAPLPRPAALELRLHSNPFAPPADWRLHVAQDNQVIADLATGPDWRVYRLLLPPGSAAPLELRSPTLSPGPADPRALGFALDRLSLQPLPGPAPAAGASWRYAAILAIYAGLALLPAGSIDQALSGAPTQRARRRRLGLLAGALALGLAIWVVRNPYFLAWVLPPDPVPPLRLALLAAVVWLLLRFGDRLARLPLLPLLATSALPAHLLLLPLWPFPLRGLAAWWLAALPGALAGLLLLPQERDLLTRLFLMIAGATIVAPMLLLGLHALPGGVAWWLLLLTLDLLLIALLLPALRRPPPPPIPGEHPWLLLLLLLLLALGMRGLFLGGSEFQGDEARALHLAAGVMHGQEDVLVLHTKGPVEALLPGAGLVLAGTTNELFARLPFTVAGIGVLLGVYLLARRLFDSETAPRAGMWAGLIAGLILSIDGFLIGFGRLVQYQSVVMLTMTAAFWCCWRFYCGAERPRRYLLAAAALAAVGMLSHYDAAAVLPLLAWLTLAGAWRHGLNWRERLSFVWPPLLLGALLLAGFYLPFVLNERFSRTAEYLFGRTRDNEATAVAFNNLPEYYRLVTFYTAPHQIHALAAILAAGLFTWILLYTRPRPLGWLLGVFWATAWLLLIFAAERFQLPAANWAIAAFGLPLLGPILAPTTPAGLRAALLWFAFPFVAMAFLIADPRTHFYTMHPAAALLIGLILLRLGHWLAGHRLAGLRYPLGIATGAALLLGAFYAQLAFVRPFPEYQRSFPAARLALYAGAYGDALPAGGFFGFVHRDGWKIAGELYARRSIVGDYDSNQKDHITGWYTRAALLCPEQPAYYFTAPGEPNLVIPEGYDLYGIVNQGPRRSLEIYSREAVAGPPEQFTYHEFDAQFDAMAVTPYPLSPFLYEVVPAFPLQATWQNGARLRGFDLDHQEIAAGETATAWLYWQAERSLEPDFLPVLRIVRAGEPVAEVELVCGSSSITAWHSREVNTASYRIDNLPPGEYVLRAGLRSHAGGTWLPLESGASGVDIARLRVIAAAGGE
jgi:4-amino-4-deoxy-L-arabinose transferase-like glycosyltransferase